VPQCGTYVMFLCHTSLNVRKRHWLCWCRIKPWLIHLKLTAVELTLLVALYCFKQSFKYSRCGGLTLANSLRATQLLTCPPLQSRWRTKDRKAVDWDTERILTNYHYEKKRLDLGKWIQKLKHQLKHHFSLTPQSLINFIPSFLTLLPASRVQDDCCHLTTTPLSFLPVSFFACFSESSPAWAAVRKYPSALS